MDVYDVLIAALLHDVGKPMQRGEILKKPDTVGYCPQNAKHAHHLHVEWTNSFFMDHAPMLETAAKLASSHHKVEAYSPESETWAAQIISLADHVVAGHDRGEKKTTSYKSKQLASIFPEVSFDTGKAHKQCTVPLISQQQFIQTMIAGDSLWGKETSNNKVQEYHNLCEGFSLQFDALYAAYEKNRNKPLFTTAVQRLIEEYFWCVPSNTQEKTPLSSLYHHSKATALIAGLLYQLYKDNPERIAAIKHDDTEKRFLMIGVELKGIQSYIFNLSEEQTKHTAKLLRARSFKVKALTDMMVHYLISELHITQQNIIFEAGAKCVLMAPDTAHTKEVVKRCRAVMERELFEFTQATIGININADVALSLADFAGDGFSRAYSTLKTAMNATRNTLFSSALLQNGAWDEAAFVFADETPGAALCTVCHRRMATQGDTCQLCDQEIKLGKELQHASYAEIGSQVKDPLICLFDGTVNFGLHRRLQPAYCTQEQNQYFVFDDSSLLFPLKANAASLPRWKEEYKWQTDKRVGENEPLSFDVIGDLALIPQPAGSPVGTNYLAVLKGDVDNLGLIFTQGIRDRFNITVWTSLSAQIDLFFSRYIPALIKDRYQEVYTMYTGGDDFSLVGPWNKMMHFAQELNHRFNDFVTNEDIHFSAGYALMHSKDPIRHAMTEAEEKLKQAKNEGKNNISLLDSTMQWSLFSQQLSLADTYYQWIHQGVFTMQMLQKLFEFNRMYRSYNHSKSTDVKQLLYLARMHYHFNRQVYQNKHLPQEMKSQVEQHEKELALRKSDTMHHLDVAITYVLYNNRKGGNHGL
jgi:CRISPR-associated protein Csm1